MRAHAFFLFFLSFFAGFFAFSDPYIPQPESHSFLKLGEKYSVPVYARPVQGARLVIFNKTLADKLGIEYPQDPKELEAWATQNFALEVCEASDPKAKKYFATRYQDSSDKSEGSALGDGRLIWLGEIDSPKQNKSLAAKLDITAKGVKKTPLAWSKHSKESHRDGYMSLFEGISTYFNSEAMLGNQQDSTADLFVFETPDKRFAKDVGRVERTGISVRVGVQTRFAHWRYFQDNPEELKKIVSYTIKRDMGLGENHTVNSQDLQNYFEYLAKHLAQEWARNLDTLTVHGSPTAGNRSTTGSSIDNATARFIDALHVNHSYVYEKKIYGTLERDFFDHLNNMLGYADNLRSPELKLTKGRDYFLSIFKQEAQKAYGEHVLRRHGFTPEMMTKLDNFRKQDLIQAFDDLSRKIHSQKVHYDERSNMFPADFEMRKVTPTILRLTAERKEVNYKSVVQRLESPLWKTYSYSPPGLLAKLFQTQEASTERERIKYMTAYINAVEAALTNLDLGHQELKKLAEFSEEINSGRRDFSHHNQRSLATNTIMSHWDKTHDYQSTTQMADDFARALSDPHLLPNTNLHLGYQYPVANSPCNNFFMTQKSATP